MLKVILGLFGFACWWLLVLVLMEDGFRKERQRRRVVKSRRILQRLRLFW